MILPNDPKRAERAMMCRDVRMFIASHRGLTQKELERKIGRCLDFELDRLFTLGFIKKIGRRTARWFVVHQ